MDDSGPVADQDVNLSEGSSLDCHRDSCEVLQQRNQKFFSQTVVSLGENVLEAFVLGLNRFHGLVDGLADVEGESRGSAMSKAPPFPVLCFTVQELWGSLSAGGPPRLFSALTAIRFDFR
jgi:hypothetical protein